MLWVHDEMRFLPTAVFMLVALDVHVPQPACSVLTTFAAWCILAGTPLGGHLALAGCLGILSPAFPAAPGTPWGGERDRNDGRVRTPPRDWLIRNRLSPIEEMMIGAREQHHLFQATATSVDESAGQSSGLSQEMEGLDLATRRAVPSSPSCRDGLARRSSRSPRRLPHENSRMRSASTPPATRSSSSAFSIMRVSTPPDAASPEQPPDSQDSCFSFGQPPASWRSLDPHCMEHVAVRLDGNAASEPDVDGICSDLGDMVPVDSDELRLPSPLLAGAAAHSGEGHADIVQPTTVDLGQPPEGTRSAVAGPAAAHLEAPPPVELVAGARLCCPFCTRYSTAGRARGLMRHITCAHPNAIIDERARALFCAIERGICPVAGCGSMRMFTSARCPKCSSTTPARPAQVGDVVNRRDSADPVLPGQLEDWRLEANDADSGTSRRVRRRVGQLADTGIPDGALPEGFVERVRSLPPGTILHIPLDQRARLCSVTAATLLGMVRGDPRASVLEEARSKLLLGPVPKGRNLRVEIGNRLVLWKSGAFEQLLLKAEEAQRQRRRASLRRPAGADARNRIRRSKKLAADGAYRKGIGSLTTEVAELSNEQQRSYSSQLLPCSSRPLSACSTYLPSEGGSAHDAAEASTQSPSSFRHALSGIRFPALSAAGPSGARPEHLKEMLGIRQRSTANKLYKAIDELRTAAKKGTLPDSAKWILRSRLVFIKKKNSTVPRPIRVGELWRRVVAKGMVHEYRDKIQKTMLGWRQLGVALPGGAEVLVHLRSVVESALQRGDCTPVAVLDVDFKNAFPSFEWDSIRRSMAKHFPEILPWTSWCHSEPGLVYLPSGGTVRIDRGAEQGDPLGSLYCAVVMADVAEATRHAMSESEQSCESQEEQTLQSRFRDFWYIDDGQVYCCPSLVDRYLRTLDYEASKCGASRGTGADIKSTVRLVGRSDLLAEVDCDWVTDYVANTCKVLEPNATVEVLGVVVGDIPAQFTETCGKIDALHKKIATLEHVPSELVFTRCCASVCKITHLLRVGGPLLGPEQLGSFDRLVDSSMERILGGPLHYEAAEQTTIGVKQGGLGCRRATDLANLAFVASRVECRPLVMHFMSSLCDADLCRRSAGVLFDEGLSLARARLLELLHVDLHSEVDLAIAEAREAAENKLQELQGRRVAHREAFDGITPAEALIHSAGCEDPEFDSAPNVGLQCKLAGLLDQCRTDALCERLRASGQAEADLRLQELRNPTTSHSWLWALNPAHGAFVPARQFLTCLRLRVGFRFLDDALVCPRCGKAVLDSSCHHALCCAIGESTKGHYRVRDSTLQLVSLADGSVDTETPGLIPSAPHLRPADIFTEAALPGCQAALDVGIMAPWATGAGNDCCEAMYQRKLRDYGPYLQELTDANIRYIPLTFSSFGRVHPEALAVLTGIAMRAARRKGFGNHELLLQRALSSISVQIQKRAAAMVDRCLPKSSCEEIEVLFGDDPSVPMSDDSGSEADAADEALGSMALGAEMFF